MIRPPDLRRPAAIDARWLTAILQGAGVDAVVEGFTAQGVGAGQIGESIRFTLAYERCGEDAPSSLVGKFPSPDADSRQTGHALGNYVREVRFYQHLAAGALVSTPRCLFAEVDEATSEFVLMMEDLSPAKQGDQLHGVTLDQARLAVIQAGRLHASHWNDEGLDHLPWVSGSRAAPAGAMTKETVARLWQGFKERYGDRLGPQQIHVGDWICTRFADFAAQHDGPRCLTHNDYRPDNMMFGTAAGGRAITVLDWQSFAYGTGPTDLAYFLAGALPADVRRQAEPELLGLYHQTLSAHGVSAYDKEDLKRQYGRGGHLLFMTAFIAAMIVVRTPRGDDMFLQMLGGAAQHLVDHDALDP